MNLLKIVIVEDEDLLRKGLIYTVDWKSLGCVVIGEAANGKEGMETIRLLEPDIVITDIKMPIKDGLEMLQEFGERSFETIIITGYGEFEYAKKAIDMKVSHFILKPVDESKLTESIEQLRSKIRDRKDVDAMRKIYKQTEETDLFEGRNVVPSASHYSKYTQKILEMVERHYDQKLTLDILSEALGISVGYISKVFKEDTTYTFNDYLSRFRIQRSIDLLYSGKYRLYEIAEQTGFSEYKYFFHVFKSYLNCSPTEFLEANYYIKGDGK